MIINTRRKEETTEVRAKGRRQGSKIKPTWGACWKTAKRKSESTKEEEESFS